MYNTHLHFTCRIWFVKYLWIKFLTSHFIGWQKHFFLSLYLRSYHWII